MGPDEGAIEYDELDYESESSAKELAQGLREELFSEMLSSLILDSQRDNACTKNICTCII